MTSPDLEPAQRERLLALLHADRGKSAARLELLMRRLSCFFRWERVSNPTGCAASLIRELANQLETGAEVLDVESYALDLARAWRDRYPAQRVESEVRLDQSRAEAVTAWLASIPASDRDLLARWFPFDPEVRSAMRSGLAAPGNARRHRLLRQALDLRERCHQVVHENPDRGA